MSNEIKLPGRTLAQVNILFSERKLAMRLTIGLEATNIQPE